MASCTCAFITAVTRSISASGSVDRDVMIAVGGASRRSIVWSLRRTASS